MSSHVLVVESKAHTAPGCRVQVSSAAEPAIHERPVLHLADPSSPQHTLCGLPLSDVEIGAYWEHLDGDPADPKWVRTVFGYDGRLGEPCPVCLQHQPPVLAKEGQ